MAGSSGQLNRAFNLYDYNGNPIDTSISGAKRLLDVAIFDASGNQITSFGGSGGGVDPVGLKNVAATAINPATEDTLALIKAKTDNLNVPLGDLTTPSDTQPVSGTFWQATQPVSGPLTDVQLRATPVPVSGTVTATTGGLTDTQLRASAVPVSAASLPLPSGAATSAKQDTLLTELQLKADLTETQPVSLASVPSHSVTNAGTFVVQVDGAALTALQLIDDTVVAQGTALGSTKVGLIGASVTTAAPTYTTGQISPLSLTTAGALRVDNSGVTQPVSGTVAVSGNVTVIQGTGTNLHTVLDSGTLTTLTTLTGGGVAHDGVATSVNPHLVGGYASAAAPSDVSADGDSVRAWHLRNGARASVITAAGALIGGDAANGLDVDVTRLPSLVAGSAIIGNVRIDQTTPGTTNAVSLAQLGAATIATGNGASSTGVLRVAQVNDGTGVLATVSTVTNLSQLGGAAVSMNTGVRDAGTQRVTIATNDVVPVAQSGTWVVTASNPTVATATLSNVASSATNVTLIASNASRKMATIFNDSTKSLFVKFGATASATSFNVRISAGGYFEFPLPAYTGTVDGIWASANGTARVMEE